MRWHWSVEKHASVWWISGKTNYFCSFFEICDLKRVFDLKMKFENQQWRLTEVCDCSSEQQRALCVNLQKEGREFGLNNHLGLEVGDYYQVSSVSMHGFEAGCRGNRKQGVERGEQKGSLCRGGCSGTMTLVSSSLSLSQVLGGIQTQSGVAAIFACMCAGVGVSAHLEMQIKSLCSHIQLCSLWLEISWLASSRVLPKVDSTSTFLGDLCFWRSGRFGLNGPLVGG